jgi:hypothetical protein
VDLAGANSDIDGSDLSLITSEAGNPHFHVALFVSLSRHSAIFNKWALSGMAADSPVYGSAVTLKIGPAQPLSTSLSDAIFSLQN